MFRSAGSNFPRKFPTKFDVHVLFPQAPTYLTFMEPCIVNVFLSITKQMQHYIIFFIIVNALHVSGGFSARHQELKNCTHSIRYMSSLLAATVRVGEFQCSTCFRRFLRPSSGAQKLYTQHRVYVKLACCYRSRG